MPRLEGRRAFRDYYQSMPKDKGLLTKEKDSITVAVKNTLDALGGRSSNQGKIEFFSANEKFTVDTKELRQKDIKAFSLFLSRFFKTQEFPEKEALEIKEKIEAVQENLSVEDRSQNNLINELQKAKGQLLLHEVFEKPSPTEDKSKSRGVKNKLTALLIAEQEKAKKLEEKKNKPILKILAPTGGVTGVLGLSTIALAFVFANPFLAAVGFIVMLGGFILFGLSIRAYRESVRELKKSLQELETLECYRKQALDPAFEKFIDSRPSPESTYERLRKEDSFLRGFFYGYEQVVQTEKNPRPSQ